MPKILYFASFGVPSGSKIDDLCTDGQKRASFAPQKCKPKAQSKAGEPSGLALRLCFESMAVVFTIDGACILTSICHRWCLFARQSTVCAFTERGITRIQSSTTIETHTFATDHFRPRFSPALRIFKLPGGKYPRFS